MVDTVKESNVFPVNSNGEILLQSGTGDNVVAGYIPSGSIPKHTTTDKMVVKLPDELPGQSSAVVPVARYGIFPSDTTDHTALLIVAITAATAGGFDLGFEAGRYNYSGLISNIGCGFRGVRGKTLIYATTSNGRNTRWDFPNAQNITVSGLTFVVPNKPAVPSNDATEPDGILRFAFGSNIHVEYCDFIDPYGTPILFRSIDYGSITHCRSIGAWKDSFHITGLSKRITRAFCEVINGGDDAFPIVGYLSGGTTGQPENIVDFSCHVRGVKFARAFAYVGAKDVVNYGCTVDGKIPAEYSPTDAFSTISGLYICSEASFDSYGNDNILVDGMTITNCGKGSTNSVHMVSRPEAVTQNITLRNIKVSNSAKAAIYADGGTNKILGLTIDTAIVYDTSDPNAVIGTAGTGSGVGILLSNVDNLTIRKTRVAETGGAGVNIGTSCGKTVDIDVITENINKSGAAGNDIVFLGANPVAREINIKINVEAQTQVNSAGTPYFIDRILEATTSNGKIRKLEVECMPNLDKAILSTTPHVAISVTASPFAWENTMPYPVLVRVVGGTGMTVKRALTNNVASPIYTTPSSSKVAGYYTLLQGESIQATYTVAPTLTWLPTVGI